MSECHGIYKSAVIKFLHEAVQELQWKTSKQNSNFYKVSDADAVAYLEILVYCWDIEEYLVYDYGH